VSCSAAVITPSESGGGARNGTATACRCEHSSTYLVLLSRLYTWGVEDTCTSCHHTLRGGTQTHRRCCCCCHQVWVSGDPVQRPALRRLAGGLLGRQDTAAGGPGQRLPGHCIRAILQPSHPTCPGRGQWGSLRDPGRKWGRGVDTAVTSPPLVGMDTVDVAGHGDVLQFDATTCTQGHECYQSTCSKGSTCWHPCDQGSRPQQETPTCAFAVLCVQGSDVFTGLQVHAKNFTDASVAAGKRVVIIGAGKTALVGHPACPALVLLLGAQTNHCLCQHAAAMFSDQSPTPHASGSCAYMPPGCPSQPPGLSTCSTWAAPSATYVATYVTSIACALLCSLRVEQPQIGYGVCCCAGMLQDCAAEVAAGSCARTITWLFRKVGLGPARRMGACDV
jgi:hypothetical protein